MDLTGPEESGKGRRRPCVVLVPGFFGAIFLITLLSVPVTTRTTRLRQDPASLVVFKTTYPQNSRMFLPRYLAVKADRKKGGDVRLRTAEWFGTMAIVAVLGLLDYVLICRLLTRHRRPDEEPAPGAGRSDGPN